MDPHAAAAYPGVITVAGRRVALLDKARVYVCGITPYDVTHLGHAATFVWVDVLARALHAVGVDAEVCRNVTDVDDVLDEAAARAGTDYDWFAAVNQFRFDEDMARLSVRAPRHEPRAHRYVHHVVRLARHLLDADAAYVADGSVYFRGAAVAERAGLGRDDALRLAEEFGGRPGDAAKEDPFDVAVWQSCGVDRVGWDSPWGRGRPGWHAECVAMSESVFGVGVDVHCGGADLAFPHHAYHAAMAETLTGVTPYARSWLHVGTVSVDGAKMAKSAGNLVLVSDLLAEHPAARVRMMLLDRRWSDSWDYHPGLLDAAAARVEALYGAAGRSVADTESATARVTELLAHELDVPAAMDVALDAGGGAARLLMTVLGLV